MKLSPRVRAFASVATLSLAFSACALSDADLQAKVDKAIGAVEGVTVKVESGAATITGQYKTETLKSSTEAAIKAVKGVKSVVDNATVVPPAPVLISADDSLKANVTMVLKDFSTLSADVKDGVVTLGGTIQKAALPKAMQAFNALHPKKVVNKATIQK